MHSLHGHIFSERTKKGACVCSMRLNKKHHAVVVGGGISGLLAARVLIDHCEKVTLIERDHYPAEPLSRSGVPQGRQVHTFLLRGQALLLDFFPSIQKHLLERGALAHDHGGESFYCYGGSCHALAHLSGWLCSRLLIEWQIRQELLQMYPDIHFIEGYEVTDLLFDSTTASVTGVLYRTRNTNESSGLETLHADLVIDASGASSQAPDWLKKIGFAAPQETNVDAFLGYATQYYRPRDQRELLRNKLIAIQATGESKRGGVAMAIEGGMWAVVLAGVKGDYPPKDTDSYLAFAKSLPDPALYNVIKEAEPITPIYGYRYVQSRRRHYERVTLPENFLLLGDAVCSYNPIYGQGMTVAVLEAKALDACLRHKYARHLAHHFQRMVARITWTPWLLATVQDAPGNGIARWYLARLIAILPSNPRIFTLFLKVVHMLQPPAVLLRPAILLKVVFNKTA